MVTSISTKSHRRTEIERKPIMQLTDLIDELTKPQDITYIQIRGETKN